MSSALRVELMKKSLRQRVVHAVVLNKYTRDGVLEKLRKDGLNDGDEQRASTIIDDVCISTPTSSTFILSIIPKHFFGTGMIRHWWLRGHGFSTF
jgi:hypothetical protein